MITRGGSLYSTKIICIENAAEQPNIVFAGAVEFSDTQDKVWRACVQSGARIPPTPSPHPKRL